jgi:hypothetical protein
MQTEREGGGGEGSHDTDRQMTAEILQHGNLAAKNSAVLQDLPRSVLPSSSLRVSRCLCVKFVPTKSKKLKLSFNLMRTYIFQKSIVQSTSESHS